MNLIDLTKAGINIKSLFRELDRFSNYDKLDKIQAEELIKEYWNIVWYDYALNCHEDEILKNMANNKNNNLADIGEMLQKKYAKNAVIEGLKNYPSIICVEHSGYLSCAQFESNCDTQILNDTCNELREEVIKKWEINKIERKQNGIFNRRNHEEYNF